MYTNVEMKNFKINFWSLIVTSIHILCVYGCQQETTKVGISGYFEAYYEREYPYNLTRHWVQPNVRVSLECRDENDTRVDLQSLTLKDLKRRGDVEIIIEAPNAKVLNLEESFSWLQEDEKVEHFTVEIKNSPMVEDILVPKVEVSKLKKLSLLGLNLRKLNYALIRRLTNIRELTIRDNRAETLEIDGMMELPRSLLRINLIGCKLKQIPLMTLNYRSIELNLQNNCITTYEPEVLDRMFLLSQKCWLNITGNPVSCDTSWDETLFQLKSYKYLHVKFVASCLYPEYLRGRDIMSVRRSDLVPKVAPKLAPDTDDAVESFGNRFYLPCELDSTNPAVPTAFKEWTFSGSKVIAFGDEVIFKSADVIWAQILKHDGSLFAQTRRNDSFLGEKLGQLENISCYFYNAAGSGKIKLKAKMTNKTGIRSSSEANNQTSEVQQKFLTQNIVIFGLAASFVVLFFALIGCSICVWRLRKRPKQPKTRNRASGSVSRSRSRQSTTTRYSESGSFQQPDVFRSSMLVEPRGFNILQPTPEGNGSQHSSPTTSFNSQLEWDPQNDPASVYCERAVTPKYHYEVKMNAIGSRSKHGSRLYSSSSERNV